MTMDHSAVVAYVDQHGEAMARALGVGHWTRVFQFGTILDADASVVGRCTVDVDYERATIEIEPAGITDEAHLARVLFHELAHIVGAPFDLLYNTIIQTATEEQRQTWGRLNRWAHEQFVITMERARDYEQEQAREAAVCAAIVIEGKRVQT